MFNTITFIAIIVALWASIIIELHKKPNILLLALVPAASIILSNFIATSKVSFVIATILMVATYVISADFASDYLGTDSSLSVYSKLLLIPVVTNFTLVNGLGRRSIVLAITTMVMVVALVVFLCIKARKNEKRLLLPATFAVIGAIIAIIFAINHPILMVVVVITAAVAAIVAEKAAWPLPVAMFVAAAALLLEKCFFFAAVVGVIAIAIVVLLIVAKPLYKGEILHTVTAMVVVTCLLYAFDAPHLYGDTHQATQQPAPKPIAQQAEQEKEEEKVTVVTEEDIDRNYNDQTLLAIYGERRVFNGASTLSHASARAEATGFYDAVTYGFTGSGWVIEEMLNNPIYLMDVDACLHELGIVGESEWAQAFEANDNYEDWIEYTNGNWYVTQKYHLIACRYAEIVKCANYLGVYSDKDYTLDKHWPLNAETETIYEETKPETYDFYVFSFVFKDGTEIYFGINTIDGRWATITTVTPPDPTPTTPPATPTPTTPEEPTPTTTPPPATPTPTPTPTTPPPATPTPTPTPVPKDPASNPVAQGNAPIGGQVDPDDDGPGELDPEPTMNPNPIQADPTPVPTSTPASTPASTPETTPSPEPTATPTPETPIPISDGRVSGF